MSEYKIKLHINIFLNYYIYNVKITKKIQNNIKLFDNNLLNHEIFVFKIRSFQRSISFNISGLMYFFK